MANYNGNSNKFVDTLPDPSVVPSSNGVIATDPTEVPEIEQAIVDGYKDEIALRYAQFIRGKMYGKDVRESIARFSLWLDVRINSVEAKGNQIDLEYQQIQKELEDFREQFELIVSSATIDGEVKLARHSLFTEKTFNSLKARLDFMEAEHYLTKIGEINKTRTLIDNDFSKNHTVTKINEVDVSLKINPIIIATVDDNKQDRFNLRKVGVI